MELTINGVSHELIFGVRFVREVDKLLGVETNGLKFGMGLAIALPSITGYDTAVLTDIIYCATTHIRKGRPTVVEIESYIDNPDNDIELLFAGVINAIEESNATKLAAKNLKA